MCALSQWLTEGVSYSVLGIAAANTFLRFMHFRFGSHYAEYIDTIDETVQKTLINDSGKDTFVRMQSSKWFNLQAGDGRRMALCHVLALLRWHDAQDKRLCQAAYDSTESGDSDYFMGSDDSE